MWDWQRSKRVSEKKILVSGTNVFNCIAKSLVTTLLVSHMKKRGPWWSRRCNVQENFTWLTHCHACTDSRAAARSSCSTRTSWPNVKEANTENEFKISQNTECIGWEEELCRSARLPSHSLSCKTSQTDGHPPAMHLCSCVDTHSCPFQFSLFHL